MGMIGWMALATAMAANAPATVTVDDVLITAVSPRPPFSGVLRTFVVLDVRVGSSTDRLFQPYVHAAQFVPIVGQRCTVTFETERFDVSLSDRSERNVTHK